MDIEAKLSDAVDYLNANEVSKRDTVTDILLQMTELITRRYLHQHCLLPEVDDTPEEMMNNFKTIRDITDLMQMNLSSILTMTKKS